MKVYICGAETLTTPALDGNGAEVQDANTARFYSVWNFLTYELAALRQAGQFTSMAMDSGSNLTCLLPRIVLPSAIFQIALANAIGTFAPNLIYAIGGGITPDPVQKAAIETLHQSAITAGILWRDAQAIS